MSTGKESATNPTGKTTEGAKPGHDVIGGSKGPIDIGKDPLESHEGDTITTSKGPQNIGEPATVESTLGNKVADRDARTGEAKDGERDWQAVHDRVLTMAGISPASLHGKLEYSEDGDLDDEDVERLEGQTLKAGVEPGLGRRIGEAAKLMGYGVTYAADS